MLNTRLELNKRIDNNVQLKYTEQKIFGNSKEIIGCEVLLDFEYAKKNQVAWKYLTMMHNGASLLSLIVYVNESILRYVKSNINKVFINVERISLCNSRHVGLITRLNEKMSEHNISLIVEITERGSDIPFVEIKNGLKSLQCSHVKLAMDDYDYKKTDFRSDEIFDYDYIKVDFPKTKAELDSFNNFVFLTSMFTCLIVERIENENDFFSVKNNRIWGYQGFAFCQKES